MLLKLLRGGRVPGARGCDICPPAEAARGRTGSEIGPQPHLLPSHPLLFKSRGFPLLPFARGQYIYSLIYSRCEFPGREWGGLNSSEWRAGWEKGRKKEIEGGKKKKKLMLRSERWSLHPDCGAKFRVPLESQNHKMV